MKKLMIAACAIALGVVANAATVSWTCAGVSGASGLLTGGASYVFFCTSASAASDGMAAFAAADGSDVATITALLAGANWSDTKKTTAAGNFGIGTSAALGGYTLPEVTSLGLENSTKYYMYMVVTDTETVAEGTKYLIASGTATTTGGTTASSTSSANTGFGLGSQASNTTWYSVAPEPTSGLLMLLGMAGLALRRKRA